MEYTTTLNPLDFTPAKKTGEIYTFDPAEVLSVSSIEALRAEQLATYKVAKEIYESFEYKGEALKKVTYGPVARKVEEYLRDNKLSPDDPRYDDFKGALDDLSITSSYQSQWEKGSTDAPGESGQEKLEAYQRKLVEGIDDEIEDEAEDDEEEDDEANNPITPEEIIDPAVEAARLHLDSLRDTLAALSAKRQGHVIGTGGKRYEEAQKAYNEQITKLGKLEKQSMLDDETVSDITKKAEVVAFLFEEQNKLRELSMDKLKGTTVGKFVEFMNRGNVAQRIGKGILFGAGVSLVSTGAGALIGAAGATVLVGGATAALIGAGRFARGFARSDAKKGRGLEKLEDISSLEEAHNTDVSQPSEYFNEIQKHYTDKLESDITKEQTKRFRSVGAGVLGIALGTGLGFGVQMLVDSGVFDGMLNNGPHSPFSHHEVKAEAPQGVQTNIDTDTAPEPLSVDTAPVVDAPETIAPPEISYDHDFSINSGGGGIEMFQSLGLTEGNWYEVHQELLQNFPDDFYSMGEGDIGISHSGPLSLEAQQFIKAKFSLA